MRGNFLPSHAKKKNKYHKFKKLEKWQKVLMIQSMFQFLQH